MPSRVLPAAGPALDEVGGIHEARMRRHEPLQKLADRREIPVLRAEVRKAVIEPRSIGLQTGAIETTQRVVSPLLEPCDEKAAALEIGPGRGGDGILRRELPGELIEVDAEANQGGGRELQAHRRQLPARSPEPRGR